MALPFAIIGKLFASGAGGTAARMSLTKGIRNMFKGTDVGDIDIQSHVSGKVKATGKPIDIPNPLFSNDFWDKFGANIVNKYRHHIFDKTDPKDAYGQPFKPYSKGYDKSKKTGNMFRQDSSFANSNAPVLSGDLWKDLDHTVDAKNNAIYIGWNAHAHKIDWLKNSGRILTDANHPLPQAVIDQSFDVLNKELKKVMPKGKHHIKITAKVQAKVSPKKK